MVICSDTAALYLPFLDASLHISGSLQGAGRGAILRAAIKILSHLQKLPGTGTSLVRGTISLKITFVSHIELPIKPLVSLFFSVFLICKNRKKKKNLTGITCAIQASNFFFPKHSFINAIKEQENSYDCCRIFDKISGTTDDWKLLCQRVTENKPIINKSAHRVCSDFFGEYFIL